MTLCKSARVLGIDYCNYRGNKRERVREREKEDPLHSRQLMKVLLFNLLSKILQFSCLVCESKGRGRHLKYCANESGKELTIKRVAI